MELEKIVSNKEEIESARDFLFNFLENINIGKKESIRKSYLELILEQIEKVKK
jgi:adenylate cyclase class IV